MEQIGILRELAIIFAASLVVVFVFHRAKLPALPGFIVSGILLGPHALGLVSDTHQVEQLADIGVVLLLFTIGIEFSLGRLRQMRTQVLAGGFTQFILTTAVTGAVALVLVSRWQVGLFLGFLVTLSSTAIVLKILNDRGDIDTPSGRLATGVLIFQDLCVVPIMLLLPFLAGTATGGISAVAIALLKAALVVTVVLVAARTIVPRLIDEILKTRSRELFLIAIILIGSFTAIGTAAAGASLALGAFLAGLVISESDYAHQAMAELLPFRDVFISLFFVAVGMLVDLRFILAHPGFMLLGLGVLMVGKALIGAAGPAFLGYDGRTAALTGIYVAQIGEFSFVLAAQGRTLGLLDSGLYQTFLALAVLTMLATPFLIQFAPGIFERLWPVLRINQLLPGRRLSEPVQHAEPLREHVIVAGYGLNGRNLSAALDGAGLPYCIVDLNSRTIREQRAKGRAAFYGDATRQEILTLLGVETARMMVVAISDPTASRRMVRVARDMNPKLYIVARTRYVTEIAELIKLGANFVVPEEFETSIEIFSRVLAHYGVPRNDIDAMIEEIRRSHYEPLRSPTPGRRTLLGVIEQLPQMGAERVRIPAASPVVGRSLAELAVRATTGALILAIRRGEKDVTNPDGNFSLAVGDIVVLVGQPTQLRAAHVLLAGDGGQPTKETRKSTDPDPPAREVS
jgi:K+:H+ antiporter